MIVDGVIIDPEAQIRELERYQRAQVDRLLAEELQHPDAALESVSPEEDMVERDCVTSSTSPRTPAPTGSTTSAPLDLRGVPQDELEDRDLQLALMMSREGHSPPPPLPSPPSQLTYLKILADWSPNPEVSSGSSSLLPPSTLDVHSSSPDNVVAVDEDFSTAPNSPTSRSPSPPTLPSLLAPIRITSHPPPQPPSPSPHPVLSWGSSSLAAPRRLTGPLNFPHSSQSGLSWVTDEELARQLQEEEEKGRREQQEKQAKHDHQLAMALMREGVDEDDSQVVERMRAQELRMMQSDRDAQIASALQGTEEVEEMEDGDSRLAVRLQEEERQRLARDDLDAQMARALQEEMVQGEGSLQPTRPSTDQDEELARRLSEQFSPRPTPQLLADPPAWWTECPNCAVDANRRYHLIEVQRDRDEWLGVTSPLTDAGFTVTKLWRVQNVQLYQRLQFEKHSMQNGKPEGYKVNERLLFHTSSADVLVICREGLDQRLARSGRFGTGVYFR